MSSTLDLKMPLTAMGMGEMFDPDAANFDNIQPDAIKLHVSTFIQKSVISVDENGSEASTATATGFGVKSLPGSIK